MCVILWWVGRDNTTLTEPASSHANCSKTRTLPPTVPELVEGSSARRRSREAGLYWVVVWVGSDAIDLSIEIIVLLCIQVRDNL